MLRSEILGLYKRLLRYSETLKFTDKRYFVHRIRKAFLDARELTDAKEIDYHVQKGKALLERKRVV